MTRSLLLFVACAGCCTVPEDTPNRAALVWGRALAGVVPALQAPSRVDDWFAALADPSSELRFGAQQRLLELGPGILPVLLERLEDRQDPERHFRSHRLLAELYQQECADWLQRDPPFHNPVVEDGRTRIETCPQPGRIKDVQVRISDAGRELYRFAYEQSTGGYALWDGRVYQLQNQYEIDPIGGGSRNSQHVIAFDLQRQTELWRRELAPLEPGFANASVSNGLVVAGAGVVVVRHSMFIDPARPGEWIRRDLAALQVFDPEDGRQLFALTADGSVDSGCR